MKDIDIYFTDSGSIFSRIIKWRLKTDFSHVMAVVPLERMGIARVYQASHGSVNTIELRNFLMKSKVTKKISIKVEIEKFKKLIYFLEMQTGKDYSEMGAIASTFKLLRDMGLASNGEEKFFCSEYIASALEYAGIFDFKRALDYVDPKTFLKEIESRGFDA